MPYPFFDGTDALIKAQFVNSDLILATGRDAAAIQTWVNRGVLVPSSGQNPGYGQRRLYSAIEVCKIAILGELIDFGFPPAEGKKVAEYVGRKLSDGKLIDGNATLWIYRPKMRMIVAGGPTIGGESSPYQYQFVHGTFPMSPAEPTSLFLPVGMIINVTLIALGNVLQPEGNLAR